MLEPLFRRYDLSRVIVNHEQALAKEINGLSEDRILNTSVEALCEYFVDKLTLNTPEIDESGIYVDHDDVQIDVSGRFEYAVFDSSRPVYIAGTKFDFHVPFSGDGDLFQCQPSTFTTVLPHAAVKNGELLFSYDMTASDAAGTKSAFDSDLNNVKKYLGWIARDVEAFNSSIHGKASGEIGTRREKLRRDRGIIESFGFPIRRRKGAPSTFVSPAVKRRVTPRLPQPSAAATKPEPILDMEEYEHILSVISNMVMVMERSPSAFKGMGEEDLRQHFLVQLNGQYEGQATGETFNFEGKTDILIRHEGKNIFIAECKFWSGPSGLKKTIDQLLGYASWRDTKNGHPSIQP